MAATAAQLGAGLVMGQQMAQSMESSRGTSLLSLSDASKVMGVSETDVLTELDNGSLKGKKIGSTWRITQEALDEFLRS